MPRASQVKVSQKYLPPGRGLTTVPGHTPPEGLQPVKGMDLIQQNSLQTCALMAHHQMTKGDPLDDPGQQSLTEECARAHEGEKRKERITES